MLKNNDLLFKQITEHIGDTDFSGYTIQYPPMFTWNDAVPDTEIINSWKRIAKKKPKYFGLYIHIPFCKQKCFFCRYFSLELKNNSELESYLVSLRKEINIYGKQLSGIPINSLYIGGGTPSLLDNKQICDLFRQLHTNFNFAECQQIAFEGNPDFLGFDKLTLLKELGVNRLTIGLQTLDPKVIRAINRYQTQYSFFECFRNARKAKIENINVDLMVGLPSQTIGSALKTLRSVIDLKPDMIHVHPFYPTNLTVFNKEGKRLSRHEMDRREKMSFMCRYMIKKLNYRPIKFDANGTRESARNIQLSNAIEYNSPFLGLGAGAVSHATGFLRYVNFTDINSYNKELACFRLPVYAECLLTENDEKIYFLTASLRYGKIDKKLYKSLFKENIRSSFRDELGYLQSRSKIETDGRFIYSQMNSIGEYLIFSKYLYDQKIIRRYNDAIGYRAPYKKINHSEYRYILL